jgi:CRP-like cAMP-binding protein
MVKDILDGITVFDGLNQDEINHLRSLFVLKHFYKDDIIFEQTSEAVYFYILSKGKILIQYKPYDGPSLVVANVLPGDIFGWSSMLQRDGYTSTAVAAESSTAYQARGRDLLDLCAHSPASGAIILQRLAGIISTRYKGAQGEIGDILRSGMNLPNECWKRINENE